MYFWNGKVNYILYRAIIDNGSDLLTHWSQSWTHEYECKFVSFLTDHDIQSYVASKNKKWKHFGSQRKYYQNLYTCIQTSQEHMIPQLIGFCVQVIIIYCYSTFSICYIVLQQLFYLQLIQSSELHPETMNANNVETGRATKIMHFILIGIYQKRHISNPVNFFF